MKLFIAFTAVALFFLTTTCNDQNKSNTSSMEITGIIEPIGMTTWQYGTHTITNDTIFYALKSEKVDLKNLEGKTVTIMGERVEGYPVENGPIYIEVTEIKE